MAHLRAFSISGPTINPGVVTQRTESAGRVPDKAASAARFVRASASMAPAICQAVVGDQSERPPFDGESIP
jgi:hypothetical protein